MADSNISITGSYTGSLEVNGKEVTYQVTEVQLNVPVVPSNEGVVKARKKTSKPEGMSLYDCLKHEEEQLDVEIRARYQRLNEIRRKMREMASTAQLGKSAPFSMSKGLDCTEENHLRINNILVDHAKRDGSGVLCYYDLHGNKICEVEEDDSSGLQVGVPNSNYTTIFK